MKMLMIVFNFALKDEIEECLKNSGLKSFTLIPQVHGSGKSSGKHFESHIWPGKNNMIMVALTEEEYEKLQLQLRELKENFKNEGIKAFLLPLEEVI